MTDYTELVKALREAKKHLWTQPQIELYPMMEAAAAAIEELQALLTEADKKQTYQHDCICELTAENEELQAELEKKRTADCWGCKCEKLEPKRGEIVRCKECIHFAQGGWCDREFDWFPVDENDFCSMAEKMEVQDGQK